MSVFEVGFFINFTEGFKREDYDLVKTGCLKVFCYPNDVD